MTQAQDQNKIKTKTPGRRKGRSMLWTAFAIISFILLFSIISKNNAVQNWYASKLVDYLGTRTGYTFSMGIKEASLFSGIHINDVKIEDNDGVPLISAKLVKTSLRKNLFSLLFQNSINLEDLEIDQGMLNIVRNPGDSLSNLSYFLSKLTSNEGPDKKCRALDIDRITLNDFKVISNTTRGQTLSFSMDQGKLNFDLVDLCNKSIILEEIYLRGAMFHFTRKEINDEEKLPGILNPSKPSTDTFNFVVRHLLLDEGKTSIVDQVNLKKQANFNGSINYQDLEINKLELEAREVVFNSALESTFKIDQMSFVEKSGFSLDRLSIEQGSISSEEVALKTVILESSGSKIKNDLILTYRGYKSFLDFNNKVVMRGDFENSELLTSDIIYFAPVLKENDFFKENANRSIRMDGLLYGRVNNLKGKDIDLVLDKNTHFKGAFSSRNLTVPGEQLMNIRLSSFSSNPETIDKLFPSIIFSPAFYQLGKFDFTGSFDGYFHDFVAFGALKTDLGSMDMDMRLDLKDGIPNAEYSGNFKLISFQLGEMFQLDDIGLISLSAQIRNGEGLNINTVKADLDAKIDSFYYNGYNYRNFMMDGYLDKNLFNGLFSINEKNIKLNITGLVNYGDSIPQFKIDANIDHLNLYKLNISKTPLIVKSKMKVDMLGNNFDNLSGNLHVDSLRLTNLEKTINSNSIFVATSLNEYGERFLDLSSDIISFYFDGIYNLQQIPDALIDVAKKSHPELLASLPYFNGPVGNPGFYYDFFVYIPDSKNFLEIVQALPAEVKELVMSGSIDHRKEIMTFSTSIDSLEFNKIRISKLYSEVNLRGSQGDILIQGEKVKVNKIETDSLHFDATLSKNQISYNLKVDTLDDKMRSVIIAAISIPHSKGIETNIVNGNIEFLNDNWYFRNNNKIILGKDYLELDNIGLINNYNSLELDDINHNKGLKAIISGFKLELLNPFLNTPMLDFGGRLEGSILIPEIFENNLAEGNISILDFKVNDDPYGNFTSTLQLDEKVKTKLLFNGKLSNEIHTVDFLGDYDIKSKYLNSEYIVNKFPLAFLEYLLEDGISETKGSATGTLDISGPSSAPVISGQATVRNGHTKVNYLGTHYYFDNQKVNITSDIIDLSGIEIRDVNGNTAKVTGGIRHKVFQQLKLDLSILSDRIKALSTTKKDNPLYYGVALGGVNARFSGPVEAIEISLDADVFKGSELTIPVRFAPEVSEQSFIKFNQPGEKEAEKQRSNVELTGVNLDMNLSIKPGAQIKIILDEQAGDNIQGTGTGDIRLEISRSGAFEMYGNYFIQEGTYLFTALTLIQKPFSIRNGGKISWTGDPLDATIDLMADYTGERVSLDNFLQEYTVNNTILAEKARKRTDVNLLLHLTGSLLHPTVSFDLNFPNLDGEIKSYVFSKLQKLRSDQNLMYTQAVTLLSLGAFLPQDNLSGLGGTESNVSTAATGIHTGLQYSAVLLSKYLSGLFEELFSNSTWISGIDIDLNVINSQVLPGIKQDNIWPNEYTYDAKLHLFEDKASVELSGSYVNRGTISEKSYANGDFIFKYYFAEDRKLRIEAYSKREFDEFLNEWKWKLGTGINYQLEFGSIYDLKKDAEKAIQNMEDLPDPTLNN